MSRRDQLRQAYGSMYAKQTAPKTDQVDQKPKSDRICGYCKHYLEGAFTGEGRGSCNVLKFSSDIAADPPVFDLTSTDGYRCMNLMDAARCTYFEKMEFVDKDGTECSDPMYRRSMRQMLDD